jgi:branched-chain amino acid transport system permease protein
VSRSESASPTRAHRRGDRSAETRWLALCVVAALLLVFVGPYVLPPFMVNTLVRAFFYAAVALTVDILWGYTGILTFGQSAFFGIGAYAAGLVFTHMGFSGGNAAIALAAAVGGALIVALVTGWLSFYHGATALYASVVSLVLPIVLTQIIFSGGSFTGSSSGLSGYPSFDLEVEAWFWLGGGFLTIVTAGAWIIVRSDFGRLLVAIRENESRCAYLGINISRIKIALLAALSVIAAVAGYGYAGYSMVVSPELAGFTFGTELVIWVALGGRGTLVGPVLGTLVLDVGTAYLSGDLPFVWKLIVGLAFVVVIIALPKGLIPALVDLASRLRPSRLPTAARGAELVALAAPIRARSAGSGSAAVEVSSVAKHFGSLQVLRDISFRASHGELLSLVGPNGAGKTTLMRCLSDGGERSAGQVRINGHDIARLPPHRCVAFGLGRKFQTANTFETLTVAESLRIARTRLEPPSMRRASRELALPSAALQVVRSTGLERHLGEQCRYLSHGMKQALELAMVLALEPTILLLDEPTAGLTKPERTMIGNILVELARDHAMCILLIEHDLDFVRDISSRVIVLHQGAIVLDGSVQEVVDSALVREIYAGHVAASRDEAAA